MTSNTGYAFRKLYVDVVTSEGAVAVLYLSWARIFRGWYGRASVERYPCDGRYEQITLSAPGRPLDADDVFDGRSHRFESHRGPVSLTLSAGVGPWTPSSNPIEGLLWKVKVARARVSLRVADVEYVGEGYADFVEMTSSARRMGLRSLQWGRAHLPDRTVVFEELSVADGGVWRVGLDSSGAGALTSVEADGAIDARGRGRVRVGSTTLDIAPSRVLHEGDALDERRVPWAIDRLFARALTGPVRQSRWLGRARATSASGVDRGEGFVLYERVRFGGDRP